MTGSRWVTAQPLYDSWSSYRAVPLMAVATWPWIFNDWWSWLLDVDLDLDGDEVKRLTMVQLSMLCQASGVGHPSRSRGTGRRYIEHVDGPSIYTVYTMNRQHCQSVLAGLHSVLLMFWCSGCNAMAAVSTVFLIYPSSTNAVTNLDGKRRMVYLCSLSEPRSSIPCLG